MAMCTTIEVLPLDLWVHRDEHKGREGCIGMSTAIMCCRCIQECIAIHGCDCDADSYEVLPLDPCRDCDVGPVPSMEISFMMTAFSSLNCSSSSARHHHQRGHELMQHGHPCASWGGVAQLPSRNQYMST
eukprot:1160603-Pelagomonas_calceolata.AAC.10